METKKPLFITGDVHSGKTLLIKGLLSGLTQSKQNPAAFKPFDTGLIRQNALEQELDCEAFAQLMSGEPSSNWITPFLANEPYPVEMALRRDGLKIDWRLVHSRQKSLSDHYSHLIIETPPGLATPLDEEHQVLDWLVKEKAEVLYLVEPQSGGLNAALLEVEQLERSGLQYHLLFNNRSRLLDGDLMFYQWEKLEAASNRQAIGMLPTLKATDPKSSAAAIREHAPKLFELLEGL